MQYINNNKLTVSNRMAEILNHVINAEPRIPSIIDYAKSIKDSRSRNILLLRLSGKTLQEIGNFYSITRERVRQICSKFLRSARRKFKHFSEDKYLCVVSKYQISCKDFTASFNEPVSTFVYCKAATRKNARKMPLESLLEDDNIPVSMRKQVARAVFIH